MLIYKRLVVFLPSDSHRSACHISPRFQRGEDDVAPGGVHRVVRDLRQIRIQRDGARSGRAALLGVARVHGGLGWTWVDLVAFLLGQELEIFDKIHFGRVKLWWQNSEISH